jgi:hypothetical protein
MRGKKKDAGSEAVLTFRLPRALHQRLVEASGGRSLSEEMRRRLEGSFVSVPADPETRQFVDAIAAMAGVLAEQQRKWHENPTGFALLKRAVEMIFEAFRPNGKPEGSDTMEFAAGMLGGFGLSRLPQERAHRALLAARIEDAMPAATKEAEHA